MNCSRIVWSSLTQVWANSGLAAQDPLPKYEQIAAWPLNIFCGKPCIVSKLFLVAWSWLIMSEMTNDALDRVTHRNWNCHNIIFLRCMIAINVDHKTKTDTSPLVLQSTNIAMWHELSLLITTSFPRRLRLGWLHSILTWLHSMWLAHILMVVWVRRFRLWLPPQTLLATLTR